jgi:hypothetical protein
MQLVPVARGQGEVPHGQRLDTRVGEIRDAPEVAG